MRSLRRSSREHTFTLSGNTVAYEPAESLGKLKGGHSNWRGPVWFPTSFLMIESLRKLEKAFGGNVRIAVGNGVHEDADHPRSDSESRFPDARASEGVGGGVDWPGTDVRARGMTLPGTHTLPAPQSMTPTCIPSR